MTIGLVMLVAAAGGCGAALRYIVDFAVTNRTRGAGPWGTWVVNVSGSLGLGVLVGMMGSSDAYGPTSTAIGAGFLGAYTTFSTWMYETLRLIEQGAWRIGLINVLGSAAAGGAAAMIGLAAGRWLL